MESIINRISSSNFKKELICCYVNSTILPLTQLILLLQAAYLRKRKTLSQANSFWVFSIIRQKFKYLLNPIIVRSSIQIEYGLSKPDGNRIDGSNRVGFVLVKPILSGYCVSFHLTNSMRNSHRKTRHPNRSLPPIFKVGEEILNLNLPLFGFDVTVLIRERRVAVVLPSSFYILIHSHTYHEETPSFLSLYHHL